VFKEKIIGKILTAIYAVVLLVAVSWNPTASAGDTVPELLLAKVYNTQIDLNEYWVSEKLDGVRAYWNGNQLISRQGNVFRAPGWFTEDFPSIPLDGELWMGRGTFEELSGAVRRHIPDDLEWRKIRYRVFDLPASNASFDARLTELRQLFRSMPSSSIDLVSQHKVASHLALMAELEIVVQGGGEGLMLHKGSSRYRAGRSDDLLKVKRHQDAEALVIGHLPGKGKYEGMLGALVVETPNGQRFRIGTGFSDEQRADPPPIGSTITYKYFGKTANGIPRFAVFLRGREAF
jgi:DNA ligase 1